MDRRALAACLPTPRQTMGPFYPTSGIAGVGRVLDDTCRPVGGAEVDHPLEAPSRGPLDPNFRYWGEAVTGAEGQEPTARRCAFEIAVG